MLPAVRQVARKLLLEGRQLLTLLFVLQPIGEVGVDDGEQVLLRADELALRGEGVTGVVRKGRRHGVRAGRNVDAARVLLLLAAVAGLVGLFVMQEDEQRAIRW